MAYTVTNAMLDKRGEAIQGYLTELGLLGADAVLTVEKGSKTYGRAYRLFRLTDGYGLAKVAYLDDFLGMTKAEAFNTLCAISSTLWSVVAHNREQARKLEPTPFDGAEFANESRRALVEQIAADLEEGTSLCPACGDVIEYCQGHGEIADPEGFAIVQADLASEGRA